MADLSESELAEREFRIFYVRDKFYMVPNRVFYCYKSLTLAGGEIWLGHRVKADNV